MSVNLPKVNVVFGDVNPPQEDVWELRVHLGCTREVGSFRCVLDNINRKYSPTGTSPIVEGEDGHIDLGRDPYCPQVMTCRVERVEYRGSKIENYVIVSGRCWGEKIFRRVVTETYEDMKGEEIVKDIIDNYVGLSHTEGEVELIETTDTTYTLLEYENTPVFDILKYIAESADKAGVIGFDFRVRADGKFEFFARGSKTSSVSLDGQVEVSTYRRDIHRVRNKIMVYGLADKSVPPDKDAWTESLTPDDGSWSSAAGEVSLDTTFKAKGDASIKVHAINLYWAGAILTLDAGKEVNANLYPILSFLSYLEKSYNGNMSVMLLDTADLSATKYISISPGEWRKTNLRVGLENELEWEEVESGFDWSQIKKVRINAWFNGVGSGDFWIDQLYFGGRRFSAVREDTDSQSKYGLRELTETDEELFTDNECDLRAKALLDYFKDPAEYMKLRTTILDYLDAPLLPADKIHVELPNENVDGDYRIETVEYYFNADTQVLEVTLELGKVPPLLADYLYGARATTVTIEKLARTKLGKHGVPSPSLGGGGIGAHHTGHESGDSAGDPWSSEDDGGWDKITGWISPSHIGPYSDSEEKVFFRTKNIAGDSNVNHIYCPMVTGTGLLGNKDYTWLEAWIKYLNLVESLQIWADPADTVSSVLVDENGVQFGPGGAAARDVNLYRSAADVLKTDDTLKVAIALLTKEVELRNNEADTYPGIEVLHNTIKFGPGGANPSDVELFRGGVGQLKTTGDFTLDGDIILPDGKQLKWSDVNLKRQDANWLWTDDAFSANLLRIGSTEVISAARVLHNVTAHAEIITEGRFPLSRLPTGPDGKFLKAQGAADSIWAFLAAADIPDLDASKITSGVFSTYRIPDLPASKITSGTFGEARIPHTWANKLTLNGGADIDTLDLGASNITSVSSIIASGAGSGNVGTSSNYFYSMHAGDFVTHSMRRISDALEKLMGIDVEEKASFPKECKSGSGSDAGVKLQQVVGLLVEANKALVKRIQKLERRLIAG